MSRVLLFASVVLPALAAHAQTTYFTEGFDCSDEAAYGDPPGIYGWEAVSPDAWQTNLSGGVSPITDDSIGEFGSPADDYENFLLTGHESWRDVQIEATLSNNDDDAMGLVVRYASPDAYYACYTTNDQGPVCTGGNETVGVLTALIRVDTSAGCTNDFIVDTVTTFAYAFAPPAAYRMRLSAIGDTITCVIDADLDATLGSAGDVQLQYVDPTPFTAGLAGLYNFDNGNGDNASGTGGMVFDDVVITGFDPDIDGDGLPDEVEIAVGTNPFRADSDADGISDGEEAGMPQNPPDADNDSRTDAVDFDSDGDGVPDRIEAGDTLLGTSPLDTDCDGIPDFRDVDSDGDGVPDATDTCRVVDNPTQADADNDGAGDACDEASGEATLCGDVEGDGCDDCASGLFDPGDDGADLDADGICDAADSCVDVDGDGIGNGAAGNAGCAFPVTDSDDADPRLCADTDADTCDDCTSSAFQPGADGPDADGDGICEPGGTGGTGGTGGAGGSGGSGGSGGAGDTTDSDEDGIVDPIDNCVADPNGDQGNMDGDVLGDVCDPDADGDGFDDDLVAGGAGVTCSALREAWALPALLWLAAWAWRRRRS